MLQKLKPKAEKARGKQCRTTSNKERSFLSSTPYPLTPKRLFPSESEHPSCTSPVLSAAKVEAGEEDTQKGGDSPELSLVKPDLNNMFFTDGGAAKTKVKDGGIGAASRFLFWRIQ
jgi:hypothetical protein